MTRSDIDAPRLRLDALVLERGLAESRSRARDAILRGHVTVDGQTVSKPSANVREDAEISVSDPAAAYVSRAALKLVAGLDHFGIDPAGRSAIDVGASTGGFTQVLLKRGAAHVLAVDVGHDQMHPAISGDPRVTCREGLNARALEEDDLGGHEIDLVVCDVSFISIRLALPPVLELALPGARALILVKPQFEAGRDFVGKNGLLKDPESAEQVARDVADWFATQPGWRVDGLVPSPIAGGDGNAEFLMGGTKA
ncbi:TlyA family RNA methyltransferase [Aurantimonas sp. Leaf443]|uniref:TlyA family RNA methyltransferase n=1 Tax=Aurantimonas sp. Leaf443 TaxID=1736378 RepID=UPI0006F26707|nr:TlyA family RNA methyltransferase [Aurantimonas sp. Leaf443]KQT88055.1 hemolysin [Aurantimonas sp. Leaf443]